MPVEHDREEVADVRWSCSRRRASRPRSLSRKPTARAPFESWLANAWSTWSPEKRAVSSVGSGWPWAAAFGPGLDPLP